MPKSKHRKNHKKKVAARRKRLEEQRRSIKKKLQEQFSEQLMKGLEVEENPNNEEIKS
ncbi:hypothetical protein N9966_00935 [bacterium]|jgi:hypothetical protein|nr:hypothetical protein [bacterium]